MKVLELRWRRLSGVDVVGKTRSSVLEMLNLRCFQNIQRYMLARQLLGMEFRVLKAIKLDEMKDWIQGHPTLRAGEMRWSQQGDLDWAGELEGTPGEHGVVETTWRGSFNERMSSHVKSPDSSSKMRPDNWPLSLATWRLSVTLLGAIYQSTVYMKKIGKK